MDSNKKIEKSRLVNIRTESVRQRWELFHRAIAYAKDVKSTKTLDIIDDNKKSIVSNHLKIIK